jgi:hypothetical protein
MRRLILSLIWISFTSFVQGVADAPTSRGQGITQPIETTLCDLYQHPDQYAGKIVKVRGTIAGNDMWIDAFTQKTCSSWMSIVVVFPKQVKPAPDFDHVRDDSFKEFEDALYHQRPIHIEATFEGRFDSVVTVFEGKRTKTGKGYGKDHEHDGRIVLHMVSDVVTKTLPRK